MPPLLLLLTVVTGLVDAVSFLRLGHVFVANMTGNIVFLGFGLAGAPGVSISEPVIAIIAFAAGAVGGGRIGVRFAAHRGRLLAATVLVKVVVVALAVAVAALAGRHIGGLTHYVLVALLAITMGLQNAATRRIAVPDLPTTVLTLTITGLAADSTLAGGNAPRPGRRLLAILAMLLGAAIGGVLVVYVNIAAALVAALVLLVVTGVSVHLVSTPNARWAEAPA